jgi:hypothetical protein
VTPRRMRSWPFTKVKSSPFSEGEVIAIFRRSGALHDQEVDDGC